MGVLPVPPTARLPTDDGKIKRCRFENFFIEQPVSAPNYNAVQK